MSIVVALVLGLLAAVAAGSLSGIALGKSALGAELAAYMGGLYGVIAGGAAVVLCTALLASG